MSQPDTLAWFARHEARLAWRDWLSLMTAGHRWRVRAVLLGFLALALAGHGLAYLTLAGSPGLTGPADKSMLVIVTVSLLTTWSLMLSQAMESVTRAFHARGDLDLVLTSPAAAARLFAVRIVAMTATLLGMALILAVPVIDVLAFLGGLHWLGAYVAVAALAMAAAAVALAIVFALFRLIGPRRTRAMAQVIAAVIGALFAIGLQFAAILSFGTAGGMSTGMVEALVRATPDGGVLWWPAHAALGEPVALTALFGLSLAALAAVTCVVAPRFGPLALATAGVPRGAARKSPLPSHFHNTSPMRALRRKEWTLLLRDPWLMSQTLMQLLYLMPAGLLLWRDFQGGGVTALLVPVLIVAAGQLGGGLAWLAVSGEDAPELIACAPVPPLQVLRARTEAVLGGIAAIFAPFLLALAFVAPGAALVTLACVLIAAGSATAIQYWFRTQARRGLFRRRQTASRVATFAEALSSTLWAGTGALAAAGIWLAVLPALLVLLILGGVWLISPARHPASV